MKTIQLADGRERVRLETWGEIAHYLGVEARTSQRCEERLDLPIRRLDGSQAVYAFADELDDWRTRREVKSVATIAPTPVNRVAVEPVAVEVVPPTAPRARNWLRLGLAVLVLTTVGIAASLAANRRPLFGSDPAPATLAVEGTRLLALNAAGSSLWAHDFEEPVAIIDTGFRPELRKWWQRVDIEGDGRYELVAVRDSKPRPKKPAHIAVRAARSRYDDGHSRNKASCPSAPH